MKTSLVIGGTGPTGPFIINGLIDRGYEVTIFHSGAHEVEFKQPIEHIHNDPHFRETFEEAIGTRSWDLVIFGYGRLKLAAELLKGRTGRLIALGGAMGTSAAQDDPAWGLLGKHANIDEENTVVESNPERNKFAYRMVQAEAALFEAHRDKCYNATYIGYPILYGPRQLAPLEWSIIRRVLDGRRQFVIADGGLKLESRAYVENAAHAVLLAVDQPEVSAGRQYFVADEKIYTMRQRYHQLICIATRSNRMKGGSGRSNGNPGVGIDSRQIDTRVLADNQHGALRFSSLIMSACASPPWLKKTSESWPGSLALKSTTTSLGGCTNSAFKAPASRPRRRWMPIF